MDSVNKIPSKVLKYFGKMEKKKRTHLIILISVLIAVLIVSSIVLNQTSYSVLYSVMDTEDTTEVLALLSDMGVEAKMQGGDTILVADDEVDAIRLELAAQGYPSSGFNYGIYGSASGLGVTDTEKQVYYQFQIADNLRETLLYFDKVEDAVVNLDLGENSSYVLSDNEEAATASIVLTLTDGEKLTNSEVTAITQLVVTSVSGLEAENVSIIDSNMNLYLTENGDVVETVDSQLELQINVQETLQEQIINLLSPVFGEENVRAEVNATLNFDTKLTEYTEYASPNNDGEGIVVSMQQLVEAIASDSDGGISGIDANGSASEYLASLDEDDNAVYYQVSTEANYEINQTITQVEEAQGQIEKLSISVILNSENDIDDYTEEVINLVVTATGAQAENITVVPLPFQTSEDAIITDTKEVLQTQQEMLASVQQRATTRLIIICAAILIILIIVFIMVKSLIRNKAKQEKDALAEGYELVADEEIIPDAVGTETDIEDFEDKNSALSILEEYTNKNPESVANLLRNWLNEE